MSPFHGGDPPDDSNFQRVRRAETRLRRGRGYPIGKGDAAVHPAARVRGGFNHRDGTHMEETISRMAGSANDLLTARADLAAMAVAGSPRIKHTTDHLRAAM